MNNNTQNSKPKTEQKIYLNPPIAWRGLFPARLEGQTVFIRISPSITLQGKVLELQPDSVLFDWGGIRYNASYKGVTIEKKAA